MSALGRKRRSACVPQSTRCSCDRCATTLQSKIHEPRLSLAPVRLMGLVRGERRGRRRCGVDDAIFVCFVRYSPSHPTRIDKNLKEQV